MQHKRTILLTGIPRSGTTLCCHLLNQQPNTVALHEPISSESFNNSDRQLAIKVINEFVNSSRTEVLASGLVQSKQLDGSIPSNPVKSDDGHLRKEQVSPGQMRVDETLSDDFLLVVKHNALFTALVNDLVKDFTCYAVVRNPLATLLSWQTVDLPIHQGYVPMGELFDPILQKDLNERETIIDRQLYILRWFYRSFSENLDRKQIIRYEDIVDTNGEALSIVLNHDFKPESKLVNQNANRLYQDVNIELFLHRLIEEADIYSDFYDTNDLQKLAEQLRAL